MKEFIVETDLDLSCVIEFTGAGDISFKPHGELIRCKDCRWYDTSDISGTVEPICYRCKRVARLWREPDDFCKGAERKEAKPVKAVKE